MKNCFSSLFVLAALLSSSFSFAQKGYDINLTVKGYSDSTAYLSYYYGKGQYYRDTTQISKKGEINFKGDDTLAHGMYSLIISDGKIFDIMICDQFFSMETDTSNIVANMKIKGNDECKIFFEYLGFLNENQIIAKRLGKKERDGTDKEKKAAKEALDALDEKVRDYIKNFHLLNKGSFTSNFINALEYPQVPEAPKNEDGSIDSSFAFKYFKTHFFDLFDFSDERLLRTTTFHEKISYYLDKLTLQDPDSLIKSLDFILDKVKDNPAMFRYTLSTYTSNYERSENMGMDAVFVHLAKNYFMNKKADWLSDEQLEKLAERANALDPLLIGKKAPNIVVKDTAQKKFLQLHDIDAEYTIVYIWSPDCGHCKVATPKLKKLYDKYKEKGVEVFGVGNEYENEEWIEFINKHNLNWINGSDGPSFRSNFRHDYDVYSTPQTYLLDKDKKILSKKMSIDSLEKILEFFLEKSEKQNEK